MNPTQRRNRSAQLALFSQRPAIPLWKELDEATRAEAARLLARLLVAVQSGGLPPKTARPEAADE